MYGLRWEFSLFDASNVGVRNGDVRTVEGPGRATGIGLSAPPALYKTFVQRLLFTNLSSCEKQCCS